MNIYNTDNNDIDMILIKYTESYLKELNYYGSSKPEQMLMLISLGSEINQIEKNIFNIYDNCVELVLIDNTNPNIYYLNKIFYELTNLILKMIKFWVSEYKDTEEFNYKSRYLIGSLENYIEKIVVPIESNLKSILGSNKIFKLNNETKYIKEFIKINKNKFTSKEKIYSLNNLLNILDNI